MVNWGKVMNPESVTYLSEPISMTLEVPQSSLREIEYIADKGWTTYKD